jgi:hypothetical protein
MHMEVAMHLQAMQLDLAREALGRAQTGQTPAIAVPGQPPAIAPAAVLDLSEAAQALLT